MQFRDELKCPVADKINIWNLNIFSYSVTKDHLQQQYRVVHCITKHCNNVFQKDYCVTFINVF